MPELNRVSTKAPSRRPRRGSRVPPRFVGRRRVHLL